MIDIWEILDELKIDYAVIDVVSKRDATEKLTGALLGITGLSGLTELADPGVDYIWIGTGKGERIEALNVQDFRVDTIHLGFVQKEGAIEKVQAISYSANPEENLNRCKKLVHHIHQKQKDMIEEGSFLIDFSKYKGMSAGLKEKMASGTKEVGKLPTQSRSGGHMVGSEDGYSATEDMYGGHNPHACGYRTGNYAGSTTTVVKKVVSTKNFKRSSKYAIGPAIESMKKKIELVKAGTYKAPDLPPLKVVEEKKEEKKTTPAWEQHGHNQEFFCG